MTDAPRGAAPQLVAGIVGKPHGLDGSFHVVRADPRLLDQGRELLVDGDDQPRRITRRAGTDDRPILRLDGHEGRTAAESLCGRELRIDPSDAPDLEDDEYWAHDLVGLDVVAADGGEALGAVAELLPLPSCDVLVVRGGSRGELLVPMVRDAITAIDVEERTVTVDAEFLALED